METIWTLHVLAFQLSQARETNRKKVFGSEEGLTDIRDATLAYRAETLKLKKQLSLLQSQFAMLSGQGSSLTQGSRSRLAATSTANRELTIVDAVHGRIASTVQELADYHSGDDVGVHLAYADFRSYLSADSCCVKELNQWFHNQLNTGPFQLIAEEGKSQCLCLDGMSSFIDAETSFGQCVSILQQRHSIFATSERQWVEAQAVNATQQAILMALKTQVALNDAHIHLDLCALGESILSWLESFLIFTTKKKSCYMRRFLIFVGSWLNSRIHINWKVTVISHAARMLL